MGKAELALGWLTTALAGGQAVSEDHIIGEDYLGEQTVE